MDNLISNELASIHEGLRALTNNELMFLSSEEIKNILLELWFNNKSTQGELEENHQNELKNSVVSNRQNLTENKNDTFPEELLFFYDGDDELSASPPRTNKDIKASLKIENDEDKRFVVSSNWQEETFDNDIHISRLCQDIVVLADCFDEQDQDEFPAWYISMTSSFIKDINNIDRKTQGLILSAITYISKHPMEKLGNTVKPLTEEYKGFWRYRIKDKYRLIYQPIQEEMKIILYSFKSRAEAYD